MGQNLSEGFRALGQGLQTQAGYYARREQESLEEMRARNMARLQSGLASDRDVRQNELAMTRDAQLEEGRDRRAQNQQDAYFDRIDKTQAAQDKRLDARLAAQDRRQQAMLTAAEKRADVTAGRQRERSSTTEYTDALTEAQAARKQLTQIAMDAGFDLGSLSTTQVQDLSRNSAAFRDQQTVLRNALQRAQGAQGMRDRYRYGSSPTSPGHAAPYRRSSPSGNLIPSPADDLIPDPAERY